MSPNTIAGVEAAHIMRSLTGLPDDPVGIKTQVASALEAADFIVEQEVAVKYRLFGSERKGRINIVAFKAGGIVAIELDRHAPRYRSVCKVRDADAYGIIGLRGVKAPLPAGVDEMVDLQVKR